jgi:hypothetical protein
MPTWVKVAQDAWTAAAGVADGYVFRPVNRGGQARVDLSGSERHTGRQVRSENPLLGCEVIILKQEFLIDQVGDVRQQPSPFVVCDEEYSS